MPEPKPEGTDGQSTTDLGPSTRSFALHSLRPAYNSSDHELYVAYIQDELAKPARTDEGPNNEVPPLRPRNIALTGGYGAGKSSVLNEVTRMAGDRIVSVSLSTLGSEQVEAKSSSPDKAPLETSPITNAIQKEIVKQLLYREKPSRVPGSRYRRIEGFRHGRSLLVSALLGAGLTAIGFLSNWLARIEALADHNGWLISLSYFGLFATIGLSAYSVLYLFHNRLRIDKVTSGPASISLTDKSESFFDQYLDEIVYFFEATNYDVVIFEDLDRFNDPYIFETLRELNTLLNNSKQIEPKAITFIYAIKDSIFEQLGKLAINGLPLSEDDVRQLAVTNRTKFFDIIIPVVPFISHRNARDLISKEMKSSGFAPDKMLTELVAKHLVDMRLIKNIHNEFSVFQQKILSAQGVKELNAQSLFAMVVYKNLHMADFEKIRAGNSNLDFVFTDYRLLVNQQINMLDSSVRAAESKIHRGNSVDSRSKALGDRLDDYLGRVLRHAEADLANASITLSNAITREDLREATFWQQWLVAEDLVLTVTYPVTSMARGYAQSVTVSLKMTLSDARDVLADPLILADWEKDDAATHHAERDKAVKLRDIVKHATMQDISRRPSLELQRSSGNKNFVTILKDHLGEGLAKDLVEAGYIDRNFSLYVSLYYDDTVTARARNYLLHSVEANVTDVNAEIGTEPEIEAMLVEAGSGVFSGKTIRNIQIFDYLLANDDDRLSGAILALADDQPESNEFLDSYFANGSQVESLVSAIAPSWPRVLTFLHKHGAVREDQRGTLLDRALESLASEVTYETSSKLGVFIKHDWRSLTSLVEAGRVSNVEALVAVLDGAEVEFDTLAKVSADIFPGVVARSLYTITPENLISALGGEKNFALNKIRSLNADVFKYVAANLPTYLEIQRSSPATNFTIDDHQEYVATLNDLPNSSVHDLWAIVEGSQQLRVIALTTLDDRYWPLVARAKQLVPSLSNISNYVARLGSIDEDLALMLDEADAISDVDEADEAQQRAMALLIINSPVILADQRIRLVKTLAYSQPLLVSEIRFDPADPIFVGSLITRGVIQDTAVSFEQLGDLPWASKRAYILSSRKFESYLNEVDFLPADLQSLVQDDEIADSVKSEVLANFDTFVPSLTKQAMTALGKFVLSSGESVGGSRLLTMAGRGVGADLIVRLMSSEAPQLNVEELSAILRAMPEKYRKLASFNGSTKLPRTAANLWLADRLIELRRVSSRDPEPKGTDFKVNLRRRA